MAIQKSNQLSPLDALYCEEGLEEEREREIYSNNNGTNPSLLPLLLLQQDLFWEDEELLSLFSREKQSHDLNTDSDETECSVLSVIRREAVEWILKVNARCGFTALTAILAINYVDRFVCSFYFQRDKPWMTQLVAVTCLSLAAKVEETQVPLLLDLQVEDTEYVFDAKTIQRMELLVLSSLQWRMNPVTPLSFLDHIIRRLGLKTHLHWEFLRRCEGLLLSVVSDWRSVRYLPSVLATATMLHVIHQVDPSNSIDYQKQLLSVLNITRERVNDCYQLIVELSRTGFYGQQNKPQKRKYEEIPGSPSGVIDASFSSDLCSNDSSVCSSSTSSSSSSSPSQKPLLKKSRAQEQQVSLPTLSRVFVDVVGSPH